MQLTKFQREAITNRARNPQILACAGFGTTEVQAQRVAHLFTKENDPLAPANIDAFTPVALRM